MSGTRSTVLGIVAITVVIVLPGLLLVVAGRDDLAGVTALAAVSGVLPAILASGRVAVLTALVLGPASAAVVTVAGSPWAAAAAMALAAAAAGATARIGAYRSVSMAAISLAFLVAQPPVAVSGEAVPALLVGTAALLSALWGALAVAVLRRGRPALPSQHSSRARSWGFAAVVGVAVGAATWFVVDLDLGHGGAWLLMTLMIVLQPYLKDAWSRTVQRALGTVVGFLLAMGLYTLVDLPVVLYLLATVLMTLSLVALVVQHRPYWQYVALLTPAIVLLEGGPSGRIVDTALERLGFTLLAAAVAVGIELVLDGLGRAIVRHRSTSRAAA